MTTAARPQVRRAARILPEPPRPRMSRTDRRLWAGILFCAAMLLGILAAAFVPVDDAPPEAPPPPASTWDDPAVLYEDADLIIRDPDVESKR